MFHADFVLKIKDVLNYGLILGLGAFQQMPDFRDERLSDIFVE